MSTTEHDLLLYARRVRLHFPLELRDVAEELALTISAWAGPKTKGLLLETTLLEILSWMDVEPLPAGADSLDVAAAVMALEEDGSAEFPALLLAHPAATTFEQLVQLVAEQRSKSG